MARTVMARSSTPLVIWFSILWDMIYKPNGISAEQVRNDYGIDYRTAHSICMKIRGSMSGLLAQTLRGVVEIDETYIGGHKRLIAGTDKKGIGNTDMVFGTLQRGKCVRLFHLEKKDAKTIRPLILRVIEQGSTIHRDGNPTYGDLEAAGYHPKLVPSKTDKDFSGRRQVNNNKIEATWMRLKHRKLKGVHHTVSGQYLQQYLDEFSYQQRDRGKWCRQKCWACCIRSYSRPSPISSAP